MPGPISRVCGGFAVGSLLIIIITIIIIIALAGGGRRGQHDDGGHRAVGGRAAPLPRTPGRVGAGHMIKNAADVGVLSGSLNLARFEWFTTT